MTKRERKAKEARLNEVVLQWKTTPQEGNEVLLGSLWNEIFILFFELYDNQNNNDLEYRSGTNYVLDVFERTIRLYDPNKGFPFSHYAASSIKGALRNKLPKGIEVSIYEDESSSDDSVTREDDLLDSNAENVEGIALFNAMSAELAAIILDFASRQSKKNNQTRLLWYRMFYTEDMTFAWKELKTIPYAHDRDIFAAIEQSYLDYYMMKKCRTGQEVSRTHLKPYEEVVPSATGNKDETPIPIPADVSLCYLEKSSISGATRSNRSNFRKEFKKVKGEVVRDFD